MQNTPTVSLLAVTLSSFLAAPLLAQEGSNFQEESRYQDSPSFEDRMAARDSVLYGKLGFDVASQYFFRGIQQENQGLIFQPWIELGADIWQSEDEEQDLRLVFGQWNSTHNGPSAPAGAVWYESRFYAGLESRLAERWYAGVRLNFYANPNGAGLISVPGAGARNITEWQFTTRFDDTGLFSEDFSLQPYALLAIEASGQRDFGNDDGVYLELGIKPEWQITELAEAPVTLSVPARIGLGLKDYYERPGVGGDSDVLGFLQAGAVVDAPLNFLPAAMGPWQGHAGLHLLVLGDNNENLNGGDTVEIIFEFGMSTSF
ncbi:MAG: hypothetical protein AB8H80_13095 [Planctomycetota bacterium]